MYASFRLCFFLWPLRTSSEALMLLAFQSLNTSDYDLSAVRSIGFWNLSPGLLRTFDWSADFNRFTVQPNNAQVWICIHGLAREYWQPKILFEIAGAVDSPLALDEATEKITFEPVAIASNRAVVDEDPVIEDLTRDKEVRPNVLVGDVLNFEEFLSSIVSDNDLAKKPRVDPESIISDLRIVGSWIVAVTDLDYLQDRHLGVVLLSTLPLLMLL
ncbi:hypothetical protein TSUD_414150 [Trifolium subterraneum]|uniref:Uncharacterized protein n=1 Tax=Trifolium subterraneum TaxID=3900 RepID=A0A2Z6PKZ3_TRISU|nr:hypothetical protein TSUD_414150 [Trifolium subterraneum]